MLFLVSVRNILLKQIYCFVNIDIFRLTKSNVNENYSNIEYQYQSIEDLMINFKYNDVYSKLKNCQNDPIIGLIYLKIFFQEF